VDDLAPQYYTEQALGNMVMNLQVP